jgi:hypothetical protein
MSQTEVVLQHLFRRGVADPKRYQDEPSYKASTNSLAEKISLQHGADYSRVIDLLILESQSLNPKGQAFALSEAIDKIDRLTSFWNWNSMAEVDRELARLHMSTAGPIAVAIRAAKAFTADKTWAFASLYVALPALLTPLASWILALYSNLMRGNNPGIVNNTAFEGLIQGAISASLAFPLWLTNKLIKTRRKPLINPRLFSFLMLLGLFLALEYLWFFYYFSADSALPIGDFLTQVGNAAKSRWFYPLPFVVITINLLMFAKFTYISVDLADAMHGDIDLVGQFGFIVVGLVSIAVSALLRLLLWFLGGIF